jgi:hypothetical protein
MRAILTDAQLTDTNLTDTNLYSADLSDALLNGANLTDANLRRADLTNANLQRATISGAFFRRTKISNITLDRETTVTSLHEPGSKRESWKKRTPFSESQTSVEDSEPPDQDPTEWDETARGYHDLKREFANNSLYRQARNLHIQERRARRLETKAEDGGLSRAHLAELASGLLTGYGVGISRITTVMILLFAISTVTYALGDITNPISYSAITFATAPPHSVKSLPTLVRFVASIETVLGTLLLVTLGFVLSNREQF